MIHQLLVLPVAIAVAIVGSTVDSIAAADVCAIEVRETAGIQRFGYPVAAAVRVPRAGGDPGRFRLRDGQRTVAAQFTLLDAARDAAKAAKESSWSVDFSIDLLPLETRTLSLEYGADVPAPAPAKRGLSVERADGQFRVVHPALEFVVAEDLRGLLRAIRVRGDDWLSGNSAGLQLHLRDGARCRWSPPRRPTGIRRLA